MKLKSFLLSTTLLFIGLTSSLAQSGYVYQEEFSGQGNWTNDRNDIRDLYVSNGKYYFEHKRAESFREFTTRTFYLNKSKDFEIETSITKISGEQDYGMSFLFDYSSDTNYREFGITATGYYRVSENNSGSYQTLKSWTSSSYIKQGNYATNKLKIKKSGNRLTFYINGSYVYGMDYKTFKGSKMGFRLWRNQKVAIDYFRVKYLGGSTTNTTTNTSSKTILFEGFNNNNNKWSTTNTSDIRLAVENGDYNIDHKRDTRGWATTINKYINPNRNFRITAQIKKTSGILNNGYGVTFGRKDGSNQNNFLISGDGSYKIVKFENGTSTNVKSWTKSSHIKTGNGVYNYLKVQKVGSAYKFYINSNLVYTSYSVKLYGNYVGFTLYDRQSISVGYLSMMYEDGSTTNTNTNTNTSITSNHTTKESILFDGYTDNKSNWSTSKNDKIDLDIRGGNYYIDHKRDRGGWSSTISKYIDTSRDFKILADIKKESGILNNGYGIIFGRADSQNQNLFYVNGNGSYSINKVKNGKDNFKKEWAKSSAVRKGNGAYNVLKVVKNGSKLEYYINNTKVYTDYSPEFFGDRLGYIIYDKQKISVAYLSVGYLDKKKTTTYNNNTNVTDNISNYTYNNSGFHFSDQFTTNINTWSEISDEKRAFKVKNGKYYLKHKRDKKGWAVYKTKYIDTSRDFEIETKIDKIGGVTNYAYGLLWGRKENNDFRFYISSGGYYKISRMVNSKEEVITKWETTSHINTGNLKSNTLKIKKEGTHYKFYINGNYITQTDYEPFYGNDLGFVLYDKQEIAVDYVRVKYLKNNNTVVYNDKTLQLPLYDGFNSNTNGWANDNLDNYTSNVANGKLNIHRKKEGGIFISRDININTSKDFVIETSVSREKTGASGLYGITFGRKNSSNEFTFLLSSSGSYMFRKFDNDKYGKIIPFTSSSAIKTGVGQSNKVKIVKSGGLLRFYINGQYVNEAKFEPFFGTKFGYTTYFEQKIAVDYLNIKYQTSTEYNSPPVVVITEPDVDLKRGFKIVKSKRIQVKGKATDKDGIFEVLINGVDATVYDDGSFVANVPLKVGTNDLVVKATDIKQASSTKTFTIKRKSPEQDIVKNDVVTTNEKLDVGFGEYYALLIGVSDYNDASNVPDLEGLPTKDAQDLRDVLVNKYSFKSENVVLLNNSPTENQILREFVKLKKKITNKDNVLIFYAGHGIYDEKTETGSWLPSDADPEYGLNMISNSTIKDYIKGINSKHTLLISDACFSGSIFKTRSYKAAPKSITRKFELPSRKAITSGTLKTVPNKSVFLKYLIDRLNKNTELYLTARKIFDRIEEPVMNNSKNVPQYGTIQEVGDEGGDFVFIRKN